MSKKKLEYIEKYGFTLEEYKELYKEKKEAIFPCDSQRIFCEPYYRNKKDHVKVYFYIIYFLNDDGNPSVKVGYTSISPVKRFAQYRTSDRNKSESLFYLFAMSIPKKDITFDYKKLSDKKKNKPKNLFIVDKTAYRKRVADHYLHLLFSRFFDREISDFDDYEKFTYNPETHTYLDVVDKFLQCCEELYTHGFKWRKLEKIVESQIPWQAKYIHQAWVTARLKDLLQQNNVVNLFSEPRTGKTITSLELFNRTDVDYDICLCPTSIKSTVRSIQLDMEKFADYNHIGFIDITENAAQVKEKDITREYNRLLKSGKTKVIIGFSICGSPKRKFFKVIRNWIRRRFKKKYLVILDEFDQGSTTARSMKVLNNIFYWGESGSFDVITMSGTGSNKMLKSLKFFTSKEVPQLSFTYQEMREIENNTHKLFKSKYLNSLNITKNKHEITFLEELQDSKYIPVISLVEPVYVEMFIQDVFVNEVKNDPGYNSAENFCWAKIFSNPNRFWYILSNFFEKILGCSPKTSAIDIHNIYENLKLKEEIHGVMLFIGTKRIDQLEEFVKILKNNRNISDKYNLHPITSKHGFNSNNAQKKMAVMINKDKQIGKKSLFIAIHMAQRSVSVSEIQASVIASDFPSVDSMSQKYSRSLTPGELVTEETKRYGLAINLSLNNNSSFSQFIIDKHADTLKFSKDFADERHILESINLMQADGALGFRPVSLLEKQSLYQNLITKSAITTDIKVEHYMKDELSLNSDMKDVIREMYNGIIGNFNSLSGGKTFESSGSGSSSTAKKENKVTDVGKLLYLIYNRIYQTAVIYSFAKNIMLESLDSYRDVIKGILDHALVEYSNYFNVEEKYAKRFLEFVLSLDLDYTFLDHKMRKDIEYMKRDTEIVYSNEYKSIIMPSMKNTVYNNIPHDFINTFLSNINSDFQPESILIMDSRYGDFARVLKDRYPDAKIHAIEQNEINRFISERFSNVKHFESIADLPEGSSYDLIAGLPYTFENGTKKVVWHIRLKNYWNLLNKNGILATILLSSWYAKKEANDILGNNNLVYIERIDKLKVYRLMDMYSRIDLALVQKCEYKGNTVIKEGDFETIRSLRSGARIFFVPDHVHDQYFSDTKTNDITIKYAIKRVNEYSRFESEEFSYQTLIGFEKKNPIIVYTQEPGNYVGESKICFSKSHVVGCVLDESGNMGIANQTACILKKEHYDIESMVSIFQNYEKVRAIEQFDVYRNFRSKYFLQYLKELDTEPSAELRKAG